LTNFELCFKKSLFINSTFLYFTCVHQKKEEIQTFFVFFHDDARKMSVGWLELYFANFCSAFSAPSTLKRWIQLNADKGPFSYGEFRRICVSPRLVPFIEASPTSCSFKLYSLPCHIYRQKYKRANDIIN